MNKSLSKSPLLTKSDFFQFKVMIMKLLLSLHFSHFASVVPLVHTYKKEDI